MAKKYEKLDGYLERAILYSIYVFAAAMPFSIALTQISIGFALLAWLARVLMTKGARVRPLSIEWGFLAYITAELIALVFSTNFSQSFIYLKRLLLIPVVYLIALNLKDEQHLKKVLTVFFVSLTIYSLWGVLSYFHNPTVRVRHIQNSMTAGGITMVASVLGATIFAVLKERKMRMIIGIMTIINLACLLLTNTRGSWLGFLVALLLIIFYTNKKWFFAIPLLIVAFYFFSPAAFSYRIKHFFDPKMSTNAKRLRWWRVGWEIYKDHPIVGIGDVSTTEEYKRYAPPDTREYIGHMHSNYVHIAVTLGTIGLIAFTYMIILIFVRLFAILGQHLARSDVSFTLALFAVSVFLAFNINGFFEWNFGDAEVITMIWFVIGLAFALPRLDEKTKSPNSST